MPVPEKLSLSAEILSVMKKASASEKDGGICGKVALRQIIAHFTLGIGNDFFARLFPAAALGVSIQIAGFQVVAAKHHGNRVGQAEIGDRRRIGADFLLKQQVFDDCYVFGYRLRRLDQQRGLSDRGSYVVFAFEHRLSLFVLQCRMTNDAVDVGGDRFRQNDEQRRHFQRRFQTGGLVNDGTAVCTAEIRVADDAVYFSDHGVRRNDKQRSLFQSRPDIFGTACQGAAVRGGQQRMIDDAADVGGGQVGILQQQRRVSENRLAVVAGFDQTVAVFVGEGRMPEKARNMFDHGFRRV